ncbi:MAG: hypothetical protein Tsb0014_07480 [Pleurocapsa sp.]
MATNQEPQDSGTDLDGRKSDLFSSKNTPQNLETSDNIVKENTVMPVNTPVSSLTNSTKHQTSMTEMKLSPKRPWWQAWQLWGVLLVLCSGGVGYGATSMLLKLPKSQNCNKVFWPVASAAVRIYCAQTAAENQTVSSLLEAIDLVAVLPENHPLRPEINRNIEKWATGILAIGEQQFQEGKLENAIATAQQIPQDVEAYQLVSEKIESWKSIWSEGEETYAKVEQRLRDANWNEAFSWAVRLTDSPNQYWATTKYQESIDNINIAQEQTATLDKAQNQMATGNVDDLLEAINKAENIEQDSYTYEQAQKIIATAKEKLLTNVEQLIEQRDWQQLSRVSIQIPLSLKWQEKTRDWNILASAGTSSDLDTVLGFEEAIDEIKNLEPESQYYQLGQELTERWQLEKEDVRYLNRARELARVGTIENFNKAIAEANKIPSSNPRYSDARQEITQWRNQIQVIEDRPILNRARELAYGNNINAWSRAIAEANLISRGSPLYQEAQNSIRSWRINIERTEDSPILDQAVAFANVKNYAAAIEEAQKIRSGRVLYQEAQNKIDLWRKEIEGEAYLAEANNLSTQGTPEALAKAITIARQVSSSTSHYTKVTQNVNLWSRQILAIAKQTSNNSLERAIAIAQQVPAGTASYSEAQSQIRLWQDELYPPEPEVTPLPPSFKLEKLKKKREKTLELN